MVCVPRRRAPLAAWLIIYAVLTDRLDGLVARAVKGTSELGMQLDSFADFLNFGVAPAYLVLSYLSSRPDLPYYQRRHSATRCSSIACGAYMLCAVFRLARYNVLTDDQIPTKIFFGFPTTLTGGLIAIWMLSSSSTIRPTAAVRRREALRRLAPHAARGVEVPADRRRSSAAT